MALSSGAMAELSCSCSLPTALLFSMSAPIVSTRRAKSASLSAASHSVASRPSNRCAPPNSPRIRSSSPTTSSNSLIFRSSSRRIYDSIVPAAARFTMCTSRFPDAVQPADALLHDHRVPRQVVVHEHVAELQIAAFAARAGGEQHAAPVLVKRADALVPFGRRVRAPVDDRLAAELLDALFDQLNRRTVVAENHHAVRRVLQDLGQHVQLGVRLDAPGPLGELPRDRAVLGADMLALRQVLE